MSKLPCQTAQIFPTAYLHQHKHQKHHQQSAGLIQRLTNISHICRLVLSVIVAEKFCLRKCMFVVYKFALHGKQITVPNRQGNRIKQAQFLQDEPVWRMNSTEK